MSQEAGHEAADQHPVGPGVEGLRQRGGLHLDGVHRPHAHGAAPDGGAQSQASGAGPREQRRVPRRRPGLLLPPGRDGGGSRGAAVRGQRPLVFPF